MCAMQSKGGRMNPKYEQEIQEFSRNFAAWKEKKIVLYGIGRYTATLLEGIEGYRIIGLMDKDPANIGKEYFGIPVLSSEDVKEQANAIIINTAGTYWKLIYQRIKHLGVPVFYRNGEEAKDAPIHVEENSYWNSSLDELKKQISESEVVSFDFFDTLFSRRVCNPRDVFLLLEKKLDRIFPRNKIPWLQLRTKALQKLRENYTLDELYEEIAGIGKLSENISKKARQIELDMENRLLVPRDTVLDCMKQAIRAGKDVYVITDMYLPEDFFVNALAAQGIRLRQGHILISGVLRKSKADGALWQYYRQRIGNRTALHIGDNLSADIEKARENDIDAYYIANILQMLSVSSLQGMTSKICSEDASMLMGCVFSKLFQNPFRLNPTKGIPRIETNFEMGYCIFGPILLTFFRWLFKQAQKDGIQRLVFMSRDGYFLKEDFEEFLSCYGREIATCYIGISRQLAMTAAIETEEDIWQLVDMPYTGSLAELLEDRFGIHEAQAANREDIKKYLSQMTSYAKDIRRRYKRYVDGFRFTEMDAIVDIGYYGNNQRYLNKISGVHMRGYYFNANISKENNNIVYQSMNPCFQKTQDSIGAESGVLKYQIYLESFLTAPYGMVKDIAEDGQFICGKGKQNQLYFSEKEEINKGVKAYLHDFAEHFIDMDSEEDRGFVDVYYSTCFSGCVEFSDAVKKSFYNDNAMMHRMEANLFL